MEAPRGVSEPQQVARLGHMHLVFGMTVRVRNMGTDKTAHVLMKPVPRFWPRCLDPIDTLQASLHGLVTPGGLA